MVVDINEVPCISCTYGWGKEHKCDIPNYCSCTFPHLKEAPVSDDENYNWELNFGDYQEQARKTAIYPSSYKRIYPTLGLVGEVGEFAQKIKKEMRDGTEFTTDDAASELGDILWYVANIAYDFGLDLSYIANKNLDKLADRKERGVLGGSGDNR
jgi:NTP pyrophosphatase (non-canonical NTP hydrolase)